MSPEEQNLCDALLAQESPREMYRFLCDLCTPAEIQAFTERWRVAQLLATGKHSYRDIHDLTGVSLMTISRVARFLKQESYHGYQNTLNKLKEATS